MSDNLRRMYNSIDRLFDFWAIPQELRFSRAGGKSRSPITARQAFQRVLPVVRKLDWQNQLTLITSRPGLDAGGASAHWEFFFNLPNRRAQIICEWVLPWDEAADDYGPPAIEVTVTPFPPVNSPIRAAVKEGKLLHQQMIGMWRRECKRRPALPARFRDTDTALADFVRQGLDITQAEFSITTGLSPQGTLCWIAQARNTAYYSPFA